MGFTQSIKSLEKHWLLLTFHPLEEEETHRAPVTMKMKTF